GARAAAISNSNGSAETLLASVGLGPYLDFVVDSGEVGVEKPNPRIFELALARAGVAAAEAAYIGDFYSIDVRGAAAAGLRAVLLDPGRFWVTRDCAMAPDLLSAVRLLVGYRHRVVAQHGVDLPLHLLDLPVGPGLEPERQIRIRIRGADEPPAASREDHARPVRIDRLVALLELARDRLDDPELLAVRTRRLEL